MTKKNNIHYTAVNLVVCVILYSMIFAIIGMFFVQNKLRFLYGISLGGGLSILLLLDMYRSVQNICGQYKDRADKYGREKALFRALVFGIVVAFALYFSEIFNIIGLLLGIGTLKLSAYTQPFLAKITDQRKAGETL